MTKQDQIAIRNEYNDWRHENSLLLAEQYEKARSIIGDDKMAPFEAFSQVYFVELMMLAKGRMMKEKIKAKLEHLKSINPISIQA